MVTVHKERPTRIQIFLGFLKMGCVAFGGPVAHLAYFREEFVQKRNWIQDSAYADLVALCQFLPGPASSQVGFAIGHQKGGILGAFLAWLGFTLPSAVLMIGLAIGLSVLQGFQGTGWITGLKLAAVAVVANAIWSMAGALCPDRGRALIALGGASVLLLLEHAAWQVGVIVAGAVLGWSLFRRNVPGCSPDESSAKARSGWPYLAIFGLFLLGLPVLRELYPGGVIAVVEGFYRAGALVFGGGHVVLPLLDTFTVGQGWIDEDTFLAGYGAAQALPGPLFAFTGFLGASISAGYSGIYGGVIALVATFVPSWLLVLGVMPYWERLRRMRSAQAALMGTNAAVVGLLLAAFYDPIWTAAVTDSMRLAFGLTMFAMLRFVACPPWLLVLISAGAGYLLF